MLKHQKERKAYVGRPNRDEPGSPLSAFDFKERSEMEQCSHRLITTLKQQHPQIIDYLTRKNGTGKGQFTLPG